MNGLESRRPAAGQHWNAAAYAQNGRFVAEFGASLIEWLQPRSGERLLDLGCGDGALSLQLAEAGGVVVGLDASEELVACAVARGLDARLGDGHALGFTGEFDAVFSNAALHWMKTGPDPGPPRLASPPEPGRPFRGQILPRGHLPPECAPVA